MPIRVLVDGRPMLRGNNGIPRYTSVLAQALPRTDKSREYAVLSWRKQASEVRRRLPGLTVVASPIPGRLMSRAQEANWSVPTWDLGPVDIFHGTSFDVIRLRKAAIVATFHDISFLRVPDTFPESVRMGFDGTIRSVLPHLDHVITVSEHAKSDLCTAYSIPDEQITVVHSALDPSVSGLNQSDTGAVQADSGRSKPFVLYVGEIGPRKNLERLIAAYASIASSVPQDLLIAGAPAAVSDYPDVLAAQVRRLSIGERVRFLGSVPEEELRSLYAECDAFAFPSLYEGFGFPVLEAMSWGKPTLASNVSAIPEIAGDAALLVDPYSVDQIAEGLVAILTDDLLREQLAASGRRRAAAFTEENMVRDICAVYAKLA